MFDKYRARFAKFEEDHESVRKIKKHLQDNRQTYLVGAGCLAGGYFLRRPNVITVINEATAPTISPVFNNSNVGNVVNNVVNNGGHMTKMVKRVSDGTIWETVTDAAEANDIPMSVLSRHINGHKPDAHGEVFQIVGIGTTGVT